MIFFDFLFYFIYKFYARKEKGAASSSASIIGGLQAMNVLTICFLISTYTLEKSYLKIFFLIPIIFFQITTYIRYIYKNNNSVSIIEEKWLKLDESKKTRLRALGLSYVILSIIACFGLAIFIGSKR